MSKHKTSGSRRLLLLSAVFIACAFNAASPALAQATGFNPSDYGKAQLPLRQSVGDAADFVASNKGAFEPVSELDPGDELYKLARPIGRVDVVMRDKRNNSQTGTSCTGALLPGGHVLTNHHCLPTSGDFEPVKASILMDYLALDGKNAKRFDIDVRALEADAALDFAVAKVNGDPAKTFGSAQLLASDVQPSQSLIIIHHPLGRPKVISRFRCLAVPVQEAGPDLRHRCDTLGGSSGSLIYDSRFRGVALHKEGGLDPKDASSFNSATRMAAILQKSRILQAAAAQPAARPSAGSAAPSGNNATSPVQPAPSAGELSTNQLNDILRGK